MSNLTPLLAVLVTASMIFLNQNARLAKVRSATAQLASQAGILRARAGELEQRQADLRRQLAESEDRLRLLQQGQATAPSPNTEPIVPPDPTRQGGWPANAQYFYLPKKDLGSVGYRLLEANRLTDDATMLLGMTAAEREAVDEAYDQMWRKFRELEIQRMEPVEKPKKWTYGEKGISYHIPSLENEGRALRTSFQSSLQQTLGITRPQYLEEAVGEYFSRKLDDLGQDSRIISFCPVRQPNGNTQMMYAILNETTGSGDARVIQEPLEQDSPAAYYARLFGVDVPIKNK